MASLEIEASSTTVTADEVVWLNTTRIDVMGNRFLLSYLKRIGPLATEKLLLDNPLFGKHKEEASSQLQLVYAGMTGSVTVVVTQGEIAGIIMVIDSEEQATDAQYNMTADEEVRVKVKATDADGNTWTTNVAWSIEHLQYFNQSVLQGSPYDSETRFVPVKSSDSLYTLRATYTDANLSAPLYALLIFQLCTEN